MAVAPKPNVFRFPKLTDAFPGSQVDRFIPSRSALDLDLAHYNLIKENANSNDLDLASEVTSPSKVRVRRRPKGIESIHHVSELFLRGMACVWFFSPLREHARGEPTNVARGRQTRRTRSLKTSLPSRVFQEEYKKQLANNFLQDGGNTSAKILAFKSKVRSSLSLNLSRRESCRNIIFILFQPPAHALISTTLIKPSLP